MHRTAKLPVDLCTCNTWAVAPREENILWVFESKVLWSLFGFKKEKYEEDGGNCILRIFRDFTSSKYYYGDKIMEDDMGSACGARGKFHTKFQ